MGLHFSVQQHLKTKVHMDGYFIPSSSSIFEMTDTPEENKFKFSGGSGLLFLDNDECGEP